MNITSRSSRIGSRKGSSGGSMHFYEYEYEYEIKNTSYRAMLSPGSSGILSSIPCNSFSSLPVSENNKIKIYGYGINLI